MIAFIDDAYYSSYATLMEMMARKTCKAGNYMKPDALFFLPINIGDITESISEDNTGLGTARFKDNRINNQARKGLDLFNELFKELAKYDARLENIYGRAKEENPKLYCEKTSDAPEYGKQFLNVAQCRALMRDICPTDNANDGKNKDYVEVIHNKLINADLASVFGDVKPDRGESSSAVFSKKAKAEDKTQAPKQPVITAVGTFEYKLWNVPHKAGKLAQMMHDVFDCISEKYPEKIEAMAQDNSITAVATKEAVDGGKLPAGKSDYFRAKKEHKVGDSLYYVSTRYNREQGIRQLEKMLIMCEGNANALVIEAMPQKSAHSNNNGKN